MSFNCHSFELVFINGQPSQDFGANRAGAGWRGLYGSSLGRTADMCKLLSDERWLGGLWECFGTCVKTGVELNRPH